MRKKKEEGHSKAKPPPPTHLHMNAGMKERDVFQVLRVFQNGWRDRALSSA